MPTLTDHQLTSKLNNFKRFISFQMTNGLDVNQWKNCSHLNNLRVSSFPISHQWLAGSIICPGLWLDQIFHYVHMTPGLGHVTHATHTSDLDIGQASWEEGNSFIAWHSRHTYYCNNIVCEFYFDEIGSIQHFHFKSNYNVIGSMPSNLWINHPEK